MEHLGAIAVAESCAHKYTCEVCDYITSRKSSYGKHLLTGKHNMLVNASKTSIKCICGKVYKHVESLYRHKKSCDDVDNPTAKVAKVAELLPIAPKLHLCGCGATFTRNSNLKRHKRVCLHGGGEVENVVVAPSVNGTQVMEVLQLLQAKMDKDSALMRSKLDKAEEEMDAIKSGVLTAVAEPKVVNNYNNINLFLNERCGNAIPIQEFVKDLVIGVEDVNYALENGKANGIANIIEKRIEELGTYKRPLHCTDVKRGTMYVKGTEGWGKESGEMTKLIQDVNHAQVKGIKIWEGEHPQCFDPGFDREKDKWFKIVKCLTNNIEGVGTRKISKRCYEVSKISQYEMV